MSLFAFDESFRKAGYRTIAGIDEAGRGPLAGPVVAACVCFKEGFSIEGLKDSKELKKNQREKLFDTILENAFVGVGVVDVEVIDKINILEATRLAMKKAFEEIKKDFDLLLIDAINIPQLSHVNQKAIVKGDKKSASIAAASIVAKVIRDRIMNEYHKIYSNYGFDKHKGYATKQHIEAIKKFGPCPIHRKSFSPVRELCLF